MDWIDRAIVEETDTTHPLNLPRRVRREYLRWALAASDPDTLDALVFSMVWVGSYRHPEGPQ